MSDADGNVNLAGARGAGRESSPEGELAAAYARCEAITRERAGNFYYGIRLLPARKRGAMCAVYAFARRVDDIGDGELPPEQKLEQLDQESRALGELALGEGGGDPVLLALGDACARFALPADALSELIEGVRMDVRGVSYERFEELVLYCRRVAGGIGRLCLAIFGVSAAQPAAREHARALADDLGVAMQLTNILRDLREDAENGRVYLPAEDLRRFGLFQGGEPAASVLAALVREHARGAEPSAELAPLVRFEAERAREWFARGVTLAEQLDARSAACVLAMAGIYERLLERIAADPDRALAQRMSLPAWEKAWVAVRSVLASKARARRRRAPAGVAIGGRS
jgi:phytoene synthase